jgi:hypothetical protein
MEEWDRSTARCRCVALGGVDAHQVGIRVAGRVPLRLMAYRRSFRYLRTHLLLERAPERELEGDRALLYGAMQAGHAFIALDALAPAHGFRFWAEGEPALGMGDEGPAGERRTLRVRLPRPSRVRLMRDGAEVAAAADAAELAHETDADGVYRVEAYLPAHGRERTWILSNPIYLR